MPIRWAQIGNCWRTAVVEDHELWESDMLFQMTGARIQLAECLRSDKQLFKAYSRLPALYNTENIANIVTVF